MDTTTYDPDETRGRPLTTTELESIIERPIPEINPIHVKPSKLPWKREDKAEVIASIIRYDMTDAAWGTVDGEVALEYVARHMATTDREVAVLAKKSVQASYAILDDVNQQQRREKYETMMDGLARSMRDADELVADDGVKFADKVWELQDEIEGVEDDELRSDLKDYFCEEVTEALHDLNDRIQ